jgi:WD40 repeat protein
VLFRHLGEPGDNFRVQLLLWAVTTGRKRLTLEDPDPPIRTREVVTLFTPDGRQVLAGESPNRLLAWDAATGRLLRATRLAPPRATATLTQAQVNRPLLSATSLAVLSEDGRRLFLSIFGDGPRRGKYERSGGRTDVPVCVWDTFSGEVLHQREHPLYWREPGTFRP